MGLLILWEKINDNFFNDNVNVNHMQDGYTSRSLVIVIVIVNVNVVHLPDGSYRYRQRQR